MFVSVIIAVSIGFIVGVLACVVWPQVFCISCHCKSFTIKKLKKENSELKNKIMQNHEHKKRRLKKKIERLQNKKD